MTVMRLTSRRRSRAAHGLWSRVLRTLLVMSLWHAPIPWIHAHDLDGPQVAQRAPLSQHIAEFHARDVALPQERLEWHVHLVLPWCLTHHLPCPNGEQHQTAADEFFNGVKMTATGATAGETIGQPTARVFLAGDSSAATTSLLPLTAGKNVPALALASSRHFFETFGAASIRDLVGVRLC